VFCKGCPIFIGSRWGLTATVARQDGQESVYLYHVGPVLDSELTQELIPDVFFLRTGIQMSVSDINDCRAINGQFSTSKWYGWLGRHQQRNDIVIHHIQAALDTGRKILVLTFCKDQTYILHQHFGPEISGLINGDIKGGAVRMNALQNKRLTIAIMKCAQQGLDQPNLDTLFVLTPFSAPNVAQQVIGRVQRICEGKLRAQVIVFEDQTKKSTKLCNKMRDYMRGAQMDPKTLDGIRRVA